MTRPQLRATLLPAPGAEGAEIPVRAREPLSLLGRLRPGRSWLTRFENLYIAAFVVGILVALFWTASKQLGTLLVEVAAFYEFIWGPALLVLVFAAVLRYSTVQGFVSFSEPDCLYLLPSPVRRSDLVRPRLVSATVLLAIVGALAGILVVVTSEGSHSGTRVGLGMLAGLALGVLLLAASWHVQRLRWATALAMRLTLPLLGLAVLLAFLQSGGRTARLVALWSGPWGWGILPLTSGAPGYTFAALGALCALALAAGVSVFLTAGGWTLGGFRVRARTRSQVVASLYTFDYRSVGQAAKADKAQNWQGRVRLHRPVRPKLTVPWHGALSLLRSPLRLVWGIVLGGAGMYLLAMQPLRMGALFAGAVALYLAASSLLEPLRQEVDTPGTAKVLLPWRFERVLWLHCLLPAAILIVAGVLTLVAGLIAGFLTVNAAGSMLILTIPLVCVVTLGAALSSRRGGRVSTNLVGLAAMDTTGFTWVFVIFQLATWALVSIGGTGLAVWLLARSGFAFGRLLPEIFAVLALAAVAMSLVVSAKQRPGLMERMAEFQKGSLET